MKQSSFDLNLSKRKSRKQVFLKQMKKNPTHTPTP